MSQNANDELLTHHQVCEWLGIPEGTGYAWNHKGTGPPRYRLGKHLRYRRSEVLAWIQAQAAS